MGNCLAQSLDTCSIITRGFQLLWIRNGTKRTLTVLNCLINGPEFSTLDVCSLEVHRHVALLVLLELTGCLRENMRPHGAPLLLLSQVPS